MHITHVKIARIAFKGDRGIAESLQISGRRKESLSGWLKEANAFYSNALSTPAVIEGMAKFGINRKKLAEGQTLVTEVEVKLNTQLKEKGEAQSATQERDAAFDALQEWMSDFISISRIALESQSQYLEMLGVVEPS